MPRNTQEKRMIEERRGRVVALMRKGIYNGKEISRQLGLTYRVVETDMKAIYAEWRETRLQGTEAVITRQLAEIEHQRKEVTEQWERSKRAAVKSVASQKTTAEGSESTVSQTTEEQCGNPQYQVVLNQLAEREAKLLGLYTPEKVDVNVTSRVVVVKLVTSQPVIDVEAAAPSREIGHYANGNGHARN